MIGRGISASPHLNSLAILKVVAFASRREDGRSARSRAMAAWFKARCPIGAEEKAWVERRMAWLARQFGLERLWDVTVVLPTHEFFPDHMDGSEYSIRRLLDRVCDHMQIPAERVALRLYSEDRSVALPGGLCRCV